MSTHGHTGHPRALTFHKEKEEPQFFRDQDRRSFPERKRYQPYNK